MKTPDLLIYNRIGGEYRMVLNQGTDREIDTGWFDNLVLNAGLDRLGNGTSSLAWLSVGTGSTAPTVSDTSLVTQLASTNNVTSTTGNNLGASTYAAQLTKQYQFAQGAVVGNITEVGVGTSTGGGNLFSRSLIVNSSNVPTALTVAALDQLTVYYRITITPVLTDLSASVTISATSYPYTARIAQASNFFLNTDYELNSGNGAAARFGACQSLNTWGTGATLGAITSTPSGGTAGTGTSGTTYALGAYTNGNFYADTTVTVAPANQNPPGGITCMQLLFGSSQGTYQYQFTTPIPKDNTKTFTFVVRYAWGR